jgi:RNA polymerase sigma-70 factor (ECF subfamily)
MERRTERDALLSPPPNEKRVVDDDLRESAFRRHYAQIYRYVRRRSATHEDAEDLAQMVFMEAAARLEHFKPGATPVLAWLYTVAQRRLADAARRASRGGESLAELDSDRVRVIDDADYGRGVATAIGRAIAALPERQRRVVTMKLLEGHSFAEIAAQLGSTEAACKMRFARGLEAVRDRLEQEGVGP